MDDNMKQKTSFFEGIPLLILLLNQDIPEIQRNSFEEFHIGAKVMKIRKPPILLTAFQLLYGYYEKHRIMKLES